MYASMPDTITSVMCSTHSIEHSGEVVIGHGSTLRQQRRERRLDEARRCTTHTQLGTDRSAFYFPVRLSSLHAVPQSSSNPR
ncbi:hypothetical protein E2C01_046137 [Portunus trituberculatus]|uniref:Uncharacterized protein n=1 Tax=Portunus trituberculatus TaxID=210409 RepID=A0A5B7G4S4_PORTR|nr:hypothetical protein [Portunus trituberculatus]